MGDAGAKDDDAPPQNTGSNDALRSTQSREENGTDNARANSQAHNGQTKGVDAMSVEEDRENGGRGSTGNTGNGAAQFDLDSEMGDSTGKHANG